MIGKLKGKLTEIDGNVGMIETAGGVFYSVFLTTSLMASFRLPAMVEIYTYLQVREDALVLFGFKERHEYNFFKLLLSVDGVGPKTAFSVISHLKTDDLISAVKTNQVEILTQVPSLGRKTAMKIILELSGKLKSDFDMTRMVLTEADRTVIDALVSLGYKSSEARKIFLTLPKNLTVEEKIKLALKKTSK